MGGCVSICGGEGGGRSKDVRLYMTEPPLDEGLGHSFCYVRPDPTRLSSSKVHSEEESSAAAAAMTTTFRSISGASVSANTSTPLSTTLLDPYVYNSFDRAAAFESTTSFSSIPLQPIPRSSMAGSGPMIPGSGPMERGFMSGPIERGFMSGPIDNSNNNNRAIFSGPLHGSDQFQRSFSHGASAFVPRSRKQSLIRVLKRAISKRVSRGQNSIVTPAKDSDWIIGLEKNPNPNPNATLSSDGSLDGDESSDSQNLQWAQGKAGEDRVHVVVSEEHGWVFVGIYDGFNGPDAPDYLLSNLYSTVHKELKGLLWEETHSSISPATSFESEDQFFSQSNESDSSRNRGHEASSRCNNETGNGFCDSNSRRRGRGGSKGKHRGGGKRWKCEWDRERLELDTKLKEQLMSRSSSEGGSRVINHKDVLKALSQALVKTEEAYFDVADKMLMENPELALMGSCVLVMLMKAEDVYVMNVGDSRAVLAQNMKPDYGLGLTSQDLESINEETLYDLEGFEEDAATSVPSLTALQLTEDHCTSAEDEVQRIVNEHPDDADAVTNERVKGSLKVTRAFGAGFLKQPKWNDALLEMFRIDYKGTSPYITCVPSLYHHKLGPNDKFLILSSDGLYQYFTNEQAVSEVEFFISLQPEGDPAQHLIEELLFRAAKKAGMDFHELLEIPQGDRRRYHDDVSVIVISLEGRIWRSCV